MTRICVAVLAALPAWAHVVSMSSGDLTVDGAHAHYELRMPLYEIPHVASPETALLSRIRFSSHGDAHMTSSHCAADPDHGVYVCVADYQFAAPVESLDVECTFPAIVSPTHVHVLRAQLGTDSAARQDQAVFDQAFQRATLRFRPPTAMEIAITEFGAGSVRALEGAVQLVFLAALAVAARSRRELLAVAAMFIGGQAVSVMLVPLTSWQPAPRFVEAAAALTIAYLAIEVLMLPQAGARWLVAGALGIFHGLFLHLFLQSTGYHPGYVLAGAATADAAVIALLGWISLRIARAAPRIQFARVAASAMFVFGLAWFAFRLKG
jgi:hypothetical protein